MADANDFFEVLNLEDLLTDDEILFDFPLLLKSNKELDEEQVEKIQETNLDLFLVLHSTYYSFKQELENYFVECTKRRIVALVESVDTIISLHLNFLCHKHETSLQVCYQAIIKKWGVKWEKFWSNFGVLLEYENYKW